ncbi:MAG: hypothetical protein ACU0BS_07215 [Hasllibacter sp.]
MRILATLPLLVLVAACGRPAPQEVIVVDPVPVVPAEPVYQGKL